MNSGSLPTATTPHPTDNAEVLSQKAPSQGEVVMGLPDSGFPDPGYQGSEAPTGFEFGPQPDTAPEPSMVPDSGRRSPIKGGQPSVPVSSVQPEPPDNLLSAVVEKVQFAKNILTEACASLLTGFEVRNQNIRKYYRTDSSP